MAYDSQPILRHAIVAVIEDRGEILLVERAAADTYPGYWNAVTGSLEDGESQQDALRREALEEVGLHIEPVHRVWQSVTRRAHYVLHWWQCRLVGSRAVIPQPAEVAAWQWVRREQAHLAALMFSDSRWFFRNVYPLSRRA
jgi:8-oxo-dGTP diphosphatase